MDHQESFIDYLKYEKRRSAHTVVAYKNDLDQFVQFCTIMVGEFNVKMVDPKLVRSWIVYLMEQELTAKTVTRKITAVKSFFKFLMREEVVNDSPALHVALPKIRKKLPCFVDEESLSHLLDDGFFSNDFSGIRDKLIISLLYGAGIRLSELMNLKEQDIDIKSLTIRVLGKGNKERVVPYPKSINNLVQLYVDVKRDTFGMGNKQLFLTDKGKPIYEKLIYRVVKGNLGKVTVLEKKSPHVLRHTFATHLLNRGADLNAVKELLGHANLAATQVYTHVSFEKLHDVYKQAHPRG